eukprot:TRINITY_DN3961_c0_g3_i1.p1 TRINITY_DN3961_c0_g3~~TRINITY_DN3961_c0_g3_i1.p1  ORF type:complete len:571 (+),score=67.98 TRINITY_DN3961_c0_g3_i1:176-1888(+)
MPASSTKLRPPAGNWKIIIALSLLVIGVLATLSLRKDQSPVVTSQGKMAKTLTVGSDINAGVLSPLSTTGNGGHPARHKSSKPLVGSQRPPMDHPSNRATTTTATKSTEARTPYQTGLHTARDTVSRQTTQNYSHRHKQGAIDSSVVDHHMQPSMKTVERESEALLVAQKAGAQSTSFPSHVPATCTASRTSGDDLTDAEMRDLFPCLFDLVPVEGVEDDDVVQGASSTCWRVNIPRVLARLDPDRCPTVVQQLHDLEELGQRVSSVVCLPTIFVLGPQRTGTTDLHFRLSRHPDIMGSRKEELQFWTARVDPVSARNKFKKLKAGDPSRQFYSLYDYGRDCCHRLSQNITASTVIVEGSAGTLWDITIRDHVLAPALMSRVIKRPKFIGTLRNPVERLWSDYWHFVKHWGKTVSEKPSAEHFHDACATKIKLFTECMRKHGENVCLLCPEYRLYMSDVCRIELGLYAVFLKRWFDVYPRSSFLIKRLEDMRRSDKKHRTVLEEMFEHAGVSKASDELMDELVSHRPINKNLQGKEATMLPRTRELLTDFYRPYNVELSRMLRSTDFLWE